MRTDRLAILTEQLAAILATVDLAANLPPPLAAAAKLARMAGIDVIGTTRSLVLGWVRSLPAWAEAQPDRAAAVTTWAADVLAWLRGDTDDPPPALTL